MWIYWDWITAAGEKHVCCFTLKLIFKLPLETAPCSAPLPLCPPPIQECSGQLFESWQLFFLLPFSSEQFKTQLSFDKKHVFLISALWFAEGGEEGEGGGSSGRSRRLLAHLRVNNNPYDWTVLLHCNKVLFQLFLPSLILPLLTVFGEGLLFAFVPETQTLKKS